MGKSFRFHSPAGGGVCVQPHVQGDVCVFACQHGGVVMCVCRLQIARAIQTRTGYKLTFYTSTMQSRATTESQREGSTRTG